MGAKSTANQRFDAVIVVPPFAGIDRASLGAHVLQANVRALGLSLHVFYANLRLAARIGASTYNSLCYGATSSLVGERLFARSAYGVSPLGRDDASDTGSFRRAVDSGIARRDDLLTIESGIPAWTQEVVEELLTLETPIIGSSTTFEQTAASVAILNGIKTLRNDVLTVIGGANCEGEMADGIRSLGAKIDFVFSGECETVFPEFVSSVVAGQSLREWLVRGGPCENLDLLPCPDFSDYYDQLHRLLPDTSLSRDGGTWLPYETSRGCWWGQKKHCTFCGLNGATMQHRQKSADRVIKDLTTLTERFPSRNICMADNIMPFDYFRTLLPRLANECNGLHIFYEQKANLRLDHILSLKAAGVNLIQPGIESLSSGILKQIRKGVTARQNIALLRYARAAGVAMNWNLLYGFPNDDADEYAAMARLIPYLTHLMPPGGLYHLSIDRFSPYFNDPAEHGITDLQPLPAYRAVLPASADVAKVAYHFSGLYQSGIDESPGVYGDLAEALARWQTAWRSSEKAPPSLAVAEIDEDSFIVLDTRGVHADEVSFIDRQQARLILTGHPHDSASVAWALEHGFVSKIDGRHIPLAVAEPQILLEFEHEVAVHGTGDSLTLPIFSSPLLGSDLVA